MACAQSLESLAPFPCGTSDHGCPSGFDCNTSNKCVATASGCSDTSCGGSCATLDSDHDNCGACNLKCGANETCCNGVCSNPKTDAKNCATCGNTCVAGASCVGGSCACQDNAAAICGEECIDVQSSTLHCGDCTTKCRTRADCVSGTCTCPAKYPDTCPTTCTNFQTDPLNCGRCGNACKTNAICSNGTCSCPTAYPDECPTACTDKKKDPSNCGTCGTICAAPNADVSCTNSACVRACSSGFTDCNADLPSGSPPGNGCEAHFSDDVKNCGACGVACTDNKICSSSTCKCATPPAGGVCDIFPLCGCAANQNCTATTSAVASPEHCISAGATPPYAACTANTDCMVGYTCVGQACEAQCATQADCAGPFRKCFQVLDSSNKDIVGDFACTRHCNPLQSQTTDTTHDGCGTNARCIVFGGGTDCIGGGAGALGQDAPCTKSSECAYGFECNYSPSKCVKYCRVNITGDCTAGYTCTGYTTKQYDGSIEIGVCAK